MISLIDEWCWFQLQSDDCQLLIGLSLIPVAGYCLGRKRELQRNSVSLRQGNETDRAVLTHK